MKKMIKVSLILGLILGFVFSLNSSEISAVQVKREVLDGGGAVWLSATHYKLSSSLGQSITGGAIGTDTILYTG